jgi:hypothetical protein
MKTKIDAVKGWWRKAESDLTAMRFCITVIPRSAIEIAIQARVGSVLRSTGKLYFTGADIGPEKDRRVSEIRDENGFHP